MPIRLLALLLLLFAAGCAATQPARPTKRIAFSFDDVPRQRGAFLSPDERTRRLIVGLRRARIPEAVFFATGSNLALVDGVGGEARMAAYADAGHLLANHSWAHVRLSRTPLDVYLADLDRMEAMLVGRPGHRPWFRTPYLDEGREDPAKRDGLRAALRTRKLRNAYVTIDGLDWHLEARTVDAVRDGQAIDMAALRDLYVETMAEGADYYDALAVRATGRSPVHMLLLHETDLAALFIEDLAVALRTRGWTIVGADEAYADPIGAAEPVVPSAQGTLVELIAWEQGLPAPRWYERNETAVADRLFDARVLGKRAD